MNKSLFKSKTFWFSLFSAVLPLFPSVNEFWSANMVAMNSLWFALAAGLRMLTKDKVVLLD